MSPCVLGAHLTVIICLHNMISCLNRRLSINHRFTRQYPSGGKKGKHVYAKCHSNSYEWVPYQYYWEAKICNLNQKQNKSSKNITQKKKRRKSTKQNKCHDNSISLLFQAELWCWWFIFHVKKATYQGPLSIRLKSSRGWQKERVLGGMSIWLIDNIGPLPTVCSHVLRSCQALCDINVICLL